jgi:hypothetical protein
MKIYSKTRFLTVVVIVDKDARCGWVIATGTAMTAADTVATTTTMIILIGAALQKYELFTRVV